MHFLWPHSFWLVAIAAGLVAACRRMLKGAARHPGLQVAQDGRRLVRHVPPVLFAVAMALLLAAAARPTLPVMLPVNTATVILAMDVSGSMHADDVAPTRLGAAKAAARDFIARLPSSVRVGVVAFSDDAYLAQPPIVDRDEIIAAIDWLQPQGGTAIGSGLLVSLQSLFPEERLRLDARPAAMSRPPEGAAYAVILLTDGQNSTGADPLDAARLAASLGVRVYTVGIGTAYGQIGDERGWRTNVGIDEKSLGEIASLTGGEYFYASSAPDLRGVYASLGSRVVLAKTETEVGALLCAAAALAATLSAGLSLFWFGRVL
jgi:Ca-activated chloride channel family protein